MTAAQFASADDDVSQSQSETKTNSLPIYQDTGHPIIEALLGAFDVAANLMDLTDRQLVVDPRAPVRLPLGGGPPGTWYVNGSSGSENGCTSWTDACPDLQTALSLASPDDEIWVAIGTYAPAEPGGDRTATFQLLSGVGIYGGFLGFESTLEQRAGLFGLTILTGDLDGDDVPLLLPEFIACFSGTDVPLAPGCEAFDWDVDNDVDFNDLGQILMNSNYGENSYHVVTGSGTVDTAILDGFAITGGNANDESAPHDRGGGIINLGGSPTVTHCTFSGNVAVGFEFSGGGGGMYNDGSSNPTVTDCTFSGNFGGSGGGMSNDAGSIPIVTNCTFNGNFGLFGGGMSNFSSSPTVTDCAFSGNLADFGGGMSNDAGSNPAVTNCSFGANVARAYPSVSGAGVGGGMYNSDSSNLTVTDCTFSGNFADIAGGMINIESDPAVTNCTFSGNTADGDFDELQFDGDGGGMLNFSCSPTVANCTFSGNSAASRGGGMFNFDSLATVNNSVFWQNSDAGGMDESAQIHDDEDSASTVNYSDVQGGWTGAGGVGNIDADPLFADADGLDDEVGTEDDNLRPLPGSPAIDLGRNADVPEGITTDLDGGPRFLDDLDTPDCPQPGADCGTAPIVDMGAFEFGTDCNGNGIADESESLPPVLFVDDDASGANNGSSWDDALTDLHTGLCLAGSNPGVTEIWVAQGTYASSDCDGGECQELHQQETFQLVSGVGLYGGFAGSESTLEERAGLFDQTILTGDLNGDDGPQRVPEFVACFSGTNVPLEPGCEAFDIDGDNDVDLFDLNPFLVNNHYGENSYHVVTGSGTDTTAIIDGFAITGGNANVSLFTNSTGSFGGGMLNFEGSPTVTNCTFSGNSAGSLAFFFGFGFGGGMANIGGSGPTVTHCTFSGNLGSYAGGGMLNVSNSPTVTHCTFTGNFAGLGGGGMFNVDSSPTVTHCTFTENTTEGTLEGFPGIGGGMYNTDSGLPNGGSNPTVTHCTFSGNYAAGGGGMAILNSGVAKGGSNSTVTNCTFSGNTAAALGGGMVNFNGPDSTGQMTLTNCTFSGNAANDEFESGGGGGGGMVNLGSSIIVANCTFSENSAVSQGGGMANSFGSPTVSNSIFWQNSDAGGMDESAQIHDDDGDPPAASIVTYSLIQGLDVFGSQVGNIDSDPLFAEVDNLRLLAGSPAVDSGSNAAVPADTADVDGDGNTTEPIPFDLDGEPRFIDDPNTPDCPQPEADCGTPPIVDMGAYEFGSAGFDCNGNGVPDACDTDCDAKGGQCDPKTCGQSDDCNENGIPDECEADCNDNGIPDECDISGGGSTDCDGNGVPDECEIPPLGPPENDCNNNGVHDACDVDPKDPDGDGEVSDDCNGNAVPDECDIDPLDPDGNGMVSGDCDENDVPDECDIENCPPEDLSCQDCDGNGVPDGCDIDPLDPDGDGEVSGDCDDDGDPDECEIANCGGDPECGDCNANGIPDGCDISSGFSQDIEPPPNGDGVPDECVAWDGGAKKSDAWSEDDNWQTSDAPGDDNTDNLESVVIAGEGANVILDIDVEIDSLSLAGNTTLHVTDGNLVILDPTEVLDGNMIVKGDLQIGDGRLINAAGEVTIGPGGVYRAADPSDPLLLATLEAGEVSVRSGTAKQGGGGSMILSGSMAVAVDGDLHLDTPEEDDDKGCDAPPDLNVTGDAQVSVLGDLAIGKCADMSITSSEPVIIGGDMQNQSTMPIRFAWDAGALQMSGKSQTIEAAGEDRGACPAGLNSNFVIGALTVQAGSTTQVVDEFDNQQDGLIACDEALYVGLLVVEEGAVLLTNGCHVYYEVLDNLGSIPGLETDDVQQIALTCADLDGDGDVGPFDLALLLGNWGICFPPGPCLPDLDGDGVVGELDLQELLDYWGPVPDPPGGPA